MMHAPDGGDSATKLIGVMFSNVGRAEIFYGDSGVCMTEPLMRMRCMGLRSVALCSHGEGGERGDSRT
jgi:hypothetical protein